MVQPTGNKEFVQGSKNVNANMQQNMMQRYQYQPDVQHEYETQVEYNDVGEPILVQKRKRLIENDSVQPHTA
jgi:hypothetical protein